MIMIIFCPTKFGESFKTQQETNSWVRKIVTETQCRWWNFYCAPTKIPNYCKKISLGLWRKEQKPEGITDFRILANLDCFPRCHLGKLFRPLPFIGERFLPSLSISSSNLKICSLNSFETLATQFLISKLPNQTCSQHKKNWILNWLHRDS